MWTYEREIDESFDGEDAYTWVKYAINNENGIEIATCDDEKIAKLIASAPRLREALREMIGIYHNSNSNKDNASIVDNAESLLNEVELTFSQGSKKQDASNSTVSFMQCVRENVRQNAIDFMNARFKETLAAGSTEEMAIFTAVYDAIKSGQIPSGSVE